MWLLKSCRSVINLPLLVIGVCPSLWVPVNAGDAIAIVSYNQDIRPLLSSRCFACHGPDSESREAGLRLDQPDGDEGAHEFAIVPGSVDESEVWTRITSDDSDTLMPPPESHLKAFSKSEQALIRRWIETGARYEQHWAFAAPKKVAAPEVDSQWSDEPIDRFVLAELESEKLSPSDQADARTLIRRATFDLTGLPPTRDEIHRFVSAYSQDSGEAWENLVDELISRPQFGEHVARHWLDLVRFADTNGMHKDFLSQPHRLSRLGDSVPLTRTCRTSDLRALPARRRSVSGADSRSVDRFGLSSTALDH